jgi:hypothetical protein
MAKKSSASGHSAGATQDESMSSVAKRTRSSTRATPALELRASPPAKTEAAGPDIALVRERTRHRLVFVGVAAYASVVPLAMVALLIGKLSAAEVRELFSALNVSAIAMCAMTFYFGRASK